MSETRSRPLWKTATLAALYPVAGVLLLAGGWSLFHGDNVTWVVGLLVGVSLLLGAHHLRTGRAPWHSEATLRRSRQ